jgi:hypothetical protein
MTNDEIDREIKLLQLQRERLALGRAERTTDTLRTIRGAARETAELTQRVATASVRGATPALSFVGRAFIYLTKLFFLLIVIMTGVIVARIVTGTESSPAGASTGIAVLLSAGAAVLAGKRWRKSR